MPAVRPGEFIGGNFPGRRCWPFVPVNLSGVISPARSPLQIETYQYYVGADGRPPLVRL